ncbi:unnamed protein product [Diplocarpon coronariae]
MGQSLSTTGKRDRAMKEARDTTDTSGEEKPGLAIETLGQNFATVFQEKLGCVSDKARKAPNTFGQKVRAALASTSELIMNNPRAIAAIAASITICLTTLVFALLGHTFTFHAIGTDLNHLQALPQQLSGFTCSFTAGSCFAVLQNAMMENYGTVVVINFVAILVATASIVGGLVGQKSTSRTYEKKLQKHNRVFLAS